MLSLSCASIQCVIDSFHLEAVAWGTKVSQTHGATSQQSDARPGSITGLDYWSNTRALGEGTWRRSQAINIKVSN